MARDNKKQSIIIDPVQMNITNRISEGSRSAGKIEFNGGLLIQGQHNGELTVNNGPLVVMATGQVGGAIVANGDAYVFGRLGGGETTGVETVITVNGTLHLTSSCIVHGKIRYAKLAMYEGAQIRGSIESLGQGDPHDGA